jgi:hypothetical protein
MKGRTIREAIDVACEGLNGSLAEWVVLQPEALRDAVTLWVLEYAKNRGVLLVAETDIAPEIDALVARVRDRIRSNWPTVGPTS